MIVNRQDRICNMCSNEVEDKYHFVIKCPLYEDIRKQLLNRNICTRHTPLSTSLLVCLTVIIRIFL